MWWHYCAGYGCSLVLGSILVGRLVRGLRDGIGRGRLDLSYLEEHPLLVGLIERFLYTAAWDFKRPEFIGVWLILKATGNWKGWQDERHGRALFNVFLIGNGFSIVYGALGGLVIEWLQKALFMAAVATPSLVALLNLAVILWVERLNQTRGLKDTGSFQRH
ncbi:MAG: hypothetical protein JST93_18495 [Acidobacteria bacterium]|nr:hypothetical protein [Acidobacteriota bacterium]